MTIALAVEPVVDSGARRERFAGLRLPPLVAIAVERRRYAEAATRRRSGHAAPKRPGGAEAAHTIMWSVNSICHLFGRRRFEVEDQSTNVFWFAPPSLDESWHRDHHAFPRSTAHSLRWWELIPRPH